MDTNQSATAGIVLHVCRYVRYGYLCLLRTNLIYTQMSIPPTPSVQRNTGTVAWVIFTKA